MANEECAAPVDTRRYAYDRMVTSPPQASALMWMLSMSSIARPSSPNAMLAIGSSVITPGWMTVWIKPVKPPPTLTTDGMATDAFADAMPPIPRPLDTSDWQPSW